jgi:hypothetical protein
MSGRPSNEACIICKGFHQGHDGAKVDEDGVCATCNGMMGKEDEDD